MCAYDLNLIPDTWELKEIHIFLCPIYAGMHIYVREKEVCCAWADLLLGVLENYVDGNDNNRDEGAASGRRKRKN